MTTSAQQVATLYAQRRLSAGPEMARMQEVQALVNGDIVVPLPELNKNERSSIPNRAGEGLKQFSQRIASATPNIWCPPMRPGIKTSEDRARDRRKALFGWWAETRMRVVLRQRARYFQGYGSAPVEIQWDVDEGQPCWVHQNPLSTYPAFMRGPEDMTPVDCIFETQQTLGWLAYNYPGQTALLFKGDPNADGKYKRDMRFTVLKYVDGEECVSVVLGARPEGYVTPPPGSMAVELDRYPNRAGECPVVIPRQIVLDRLHGQFDGMIGMHRTEAMLTALSIIATRKGVFQDEWLVAHPNEEPVIVQVPDAAKGIPGVVKGGTMVPRGVDPQFQTNNMSDRLADAQMRTAGLSSEMQGVAPTNVRTGIRASNLLGNVIDFPIQEAQELFAESLQTENKLAIAFAKAYGGSKTFYVPWEGAEGMVTYKPDETFETDTNIVSYPMAGADQAGLVISGEQRVGAGTMSKRAFMDIDPLIKDPELEHDRIIGEKLEEAVLAAISQQAVSGQLPPMYAAKIARYVVTNQKELFDAIEAVHTEAQQAQATPAPQGAPETQPGLAGPPQQPGVGPNPDQAGLAQLLSSLRQPQARATGPEIAAAGPTP